MNQNLQQFIETQLNEQQKKAVLEKDGCFLVIAGAGSGKTRVITSRIAHLMVHEQVQHDQIVALTFTNKAAKEMQERIQHFLVDADALPFIGTFHAYCLKLLKSYPHLIDMPFVSIIDADDQEKIIHGILQRNNLLKQITAKQTAHQISHIKNHAITRDEQKKYFDQNNLLYELFYAYEAEKKVSRCLDFDDLLHYALKLFSHETFKQQFQQHTRHILVDEYQDTNVIQHALLKAMALLNNRFAVDSLCVVGDEDQSIYSWRGATVTNIVNFKHDFPETKIIKIEQNYRSIQSILDIANQVIQHNKQRNPKKLWSTKKGDNRIISVTYTSEYQEGEAIALFCKLIQSKQKLGACAVLYRTHLQSRAIEEALLNHAIPYKIFGGIQFYERKEIKDLLAYLRLIVNPFDRTSFFRIINCPNRGLGNAAETEFYERWNIEPFLTFTDIAKKLIVEEAFKGKKAEALTQCIEIFSDIQTTTPPMQALETIVQRSCYISYIKENYEQEDAQARIDNIHELLRALDHFQTTTQGTLEQFLHDVALMQEKAHNQQEEQDALLLMTYHAAKGLEFDTVLLVGLEENLLPSSRSIYDDNALEEERRLFYVGITRAKERLILSKSRYRYTYGKMNTQKPSRFLREISDTHLMQHDMSNLSAYAIKQLFVQWLHHKPAEPQAQILTFGTDKHIELKKEEPKPTLQNHPTSWRVNQPVRHATFGIGVITQVEKRQDATYTTVKFKTGTKKILSTFLQKI